MSKAGCRLSVTKNWQLAEFSDIPYERGIVGAARTQDVNGANCQFFIVTIKHQPDFDNRYTVFGRVISGMDAVDNIAPGEPPEAPTTIVKATLGG